MKMVWYEDTSSDRRRDFVAYLDKLWRLKAFGNPKQVRKKEIIRDLIIPVLTEGEGWIPEDMDRVIDLARRWDLTNSQLTDLIHKLWKNMVKPMDANEAGQLIGRTANTLRRWVREGKIEARVNERGRLIFCREILIDHIR